MGSSGVVASGSGVVHQLSGSVVGSSVVAGSALGSGVVVGSGSTTDENKNN